jgi:hypothetical protein
MPEERVWDLHPNADWVEEHKYYDDGYWLRQNYSPIGDGRDYPSSLPISRATVSTASLAGSALRASSR